ncbi:hypothetical protein AA0472_2366 [Acetobacter estunensis NRIC 0472]|uniref:Uncharacterized protein n=1 Tax=Acetobacter estunensis TaxID=104097 RepID=A0A967B948_9PROT|nr:MULTISPECIES: hypothetical protein [Acetobacter]NHO55183.1 hypothetical protein [Acetobacter estunensis]GBQ27253.1 hypothetical protein AA0472_2366 [Acetobacter estunensis NRIC 0472]
MSKRSFPITRNDAREIIFGVMGFMLFMGLVTVLIVGPGFFLPDIDDLISLL